MINPQYRSEAKKPELENSELENPVLENPEQKKTEAKQDKPEPVKPMQKPIERISILGERNSGTRWGFE